MPVKDVEAVNDHRAVMTSLLFCFQTRLKTRQGCFISLPARKARNKLLPRPLSIRVSESGCVLDILAAASPSQADPFKRMS